MKFVILLLFTILSLSKCDWQLSTFDDEDQSLSTNRQVRSLSENEGSGIGETVVTVNSVIQRLRRVNIKTIKKLKFMSKKQGETEERFNKLKGNHKSLTKNYYELKRTLKTEYKTFKNKTNEKLSTMSKYTKKLEDRFEKLNRNLNQLKNTMKIFIGGDLVVYKIK